MTATLLLLALAGAAAPAPAPKDPVLARVDAVQITRADLQERLRVLRARRQATPPAAALSDLVDEALLASEATRMGLDKDPANLARIDEQRRRLASEALVAKMTPEPTEELLRDLYHQTGDSIRLVLVKATTAEEARAVLDRVRKGGDLAVEARKSADPRLAARAGDTGLVSRAALEPALAAAAFKAEPGALVGPVALSLGFAVARVLERSVADDARFPERREAIAAFARERMRAEAKVHVLDQLRRKAGVQIDEEFLRNVGRSGPPSEADLAHPAAVVNGKAVPYRVIHESFEKAGTARGHGGGAARISFTQSEIERRLLVDEAVARGLDRAPETEKALAAVARNLLAGAAADRIAGRSGAGLADPAVRARVEALRAKADVRMNEAALHAFEGEGR